MLMSVLKAILQMFHFDKISGVYSLKTYKYIRNYMLQSPITIHIPMYPKICSMLGIKYGYYTKLERSTISHWVTLCCWALFILYNSTELDFPHLFHLLQAKSRTFSFGNMIMCKLFIMTTFPTKIHIILSTIPILLLSLQRKCLLEIVFSLIIDRKWQHKIIYSYTF